MESIQVKNNSGLKMSDESVAVELERDTKS